MERPVIVESEQHAHCWAMKNHFESQVSREETKWYQQTEDNPGVNSQYKDISKIEHQLSKIDELCGYIQSDGYKPHRKLKEAESSPVDMELLPAPNITRLT